MPEPVSGAENNDEMSRFVASMLALSSMLPPPDQVADIREYLLAIEAAVRALPPCDPTADELTIGFDPSWPEVPG